MQNSNELNQYTTRYFRYSLTPEVKKKYVDEGKRDKQRFEKEVEEYKKHHSQNETVTPTVPVKKPKSLDISESIKALSGDDLKVHKEVSKAFVGLNCELPIFTDLFLNHNKVVESELKLLRKQNMDIDQQNSVLMKHVENMQNGVQKVESEIAATQSRNVQLEEYLTKLKCGLASGFHSLTLPVVSFQKSGASIENIERYMKELSSPGTSPATVSKASDIIRKMNLKFVAY